MALETFERVLKLKLTNNQLGLEAGWAAIAQGRTGLAITLLEPYVKRNPKNAKAREFLGRAYIGDGRIDDAERETLWNRFADGPEPVGYDPAIIPPWADGPESPAFSGWKLDPYRLRVMPGSAMLGRTPALAARLM